MKKTTKKKAAKKAAPMAAPVRPTPAVVESDDARLDRIERRQDILRTAVDDLIDVVGSIDAEDWSTAERRRIRSTLRKDWGG